MVERKPVNVIQQMIFAVIPILDIYASYKIQKLRWWILIFWVSGASISLIYDQVFYAGTMVVEFFNSYGSIYTLEYLSFVITFAIAQAMVMRAWSKKWNASFRNENEISQ